MGFVFLAIAIASEVLGSTSLKLSEGFTRLLPSLVVVVGYAGAFYFMSQAFKTLPLSVSYAIWSGLGTAATAVIGVLLFKEDFDWMKLAGIIAILAGIVLLNLKSAH